MRRAIFIVLLIILSCTGLWACTANDPVVPNNLWLRTITPGVNMTYNLGAPTYYWNTIYVNSIQSPAGVISHIQNTDTFLDRGGANEVTAAQVKTAVTSTHTQNTDWILKQAGGGADLINSATLKSNLAVDGGITVDGVDVSDHDARHDWLGADELKIKSLAMSMPVFQTVEPDTAMTATWSGTSYDYSGKFFIYIGTGAGSGSSTGRVFSSYLWHDYASTVARHIWAGRLFFDGTNDLSEAWYGMFSDTVTFPTVTSNHYGFHTKSTVNGTNATLYASNGAGVAETSTSLIASLAGYTSVYVLAIYGASDIKYYYSTDEAVTWTLGATHTTNRPVAGQYYGAWVKNSEAVDKIFNIWGVKYGKP